VLILALYPNLFNVSYPKKDLPNVKKLFRNLLIYTKKFWNIFKKSNQKSFFKYELAIKLIIFSKNEFLDCSKTTT
jgi:hypothetical protein